MSSMSNYLENSLIDLVLRGRSFTQPSTVYLALGSLSSPPPYPTDDTADAYFEQGVVEVSSPSYHRVPVTCGLTHWSGTAGPTQTVKSTGSAATSYLLDAVAFPVCLETWAPSAITHLGIYDAPTGGNLLWYGAFNVSFVAAPGLQVRFPAKSIAVSLSTSTINFNAPAGALMFNGLPWMVSGSYIVPTTAHTPPPPPPLARIVIDGQRMLDSRTGEEVIFRGFNIGHFGTFFEGDAEDLKARGFNAVRFPLRWYGFYPDGIDSRIDSAPGHFSPANLAIVDQILNWCSAAGLWIILTFDSDSGQDGTQPGEAAYSQDYTKWPLNPGYPGPFPNGRNFWYDLSQRVLYFEMLQFIVTRYKDLPYLALIEPLAEPNPTGVSAADVSLFYQQAIALLEPIGAKVPYLVGATGGYDMLHIADAYIPGATNVVYTGDQFVIPVGTQADYTAKIAHRFAAMTDLRTSKNVPALTNQLGVQTKNDPSLYWEDTVLSKHGDAKVGWFWWELYDAPGGTSPDGYGVRYGDAANDGQWIEKVPQMAMLQSYAAG